MSHIIIYYHKLITPSYHNRAATAGVKVTDVCPKDNSLRGFLGHC